jgi:hypothetical protein
VFNISSYESLPLKSAVTVNENPKPALLINVALPPFPLELFAFLPITDLPHGHY